MTERFSRDRIIGILVLLPSIILVGIFVYGFIVTTIYISMTDSNTVQQLSGTQPNFIGFQNYTTLFTATVDAGRFRTDLVNNVFFTILFIIACLVIGIGLAILLDQKIKGESLFRTIFLFPMALSFVVTGVVWRWLFNPTSGLNALPTAVGLPAFQFDWFISQDQWLKFNWQSLPTIIAIILLGVVIFFALYFWSHKRSQLAAFVTGIAILLLASLALDIPSRFNGLRNPEAKGFNLALLAVVVAAAWQMSGYTMAMYLAGLRGISDDLREAARVDGATEFGVYRYVVFPLLQPITLSAIIILGHISLKIFDLVFVMGGGNNIQIDMPGINMFFTTYRGGQTAIGAAIAVIMLLMVAVVIVPYLWSSLRSEVQH